MALALGGGVLGCYDLSVVVTVETITAEGAMWKRLCERSGGKEKVAVYM